MAMRMLGTLVKRALMLRGGASARSGVGGGGLVKQGKGLSVKGETLIGKARGRDQFGGGRAPLEGS